MMKTNNQLLQVAIKQIGNGGAKYRSYAGIGSGQPWCDAFVYWLYNANGCRELLPWTGRQRYYCPDSIKWAMKNLAMVPLYLALPCDLIYFDWEPNNVPNHIGIVESKKSTSAIRTIEGNTNGGKVARKTRAAKYVEGIYRPHFPGSYQLKRIQEDGDFGYNSIANLRRALGMSASGILSKETVKYLQRRCGATPDGAWGPATSKKVQKMIGAKQDGDFGPESVRKLQAWINKINYGDAKKNAAEVKSGAQNKSTAVKTNASAAKKGYTGSFPALNTNAKIVNGLAFRHCWPYGTPQNKYTYAKGKPTAAYKKGIDAAYPKHKSWPNKKQRVGACCDVFVGEVLGHVGVKVSKDLAKQLVEMPKMTTKLKSNGHHTAKAFKAGDVVQRGRKDRSGHTWIVCELVNGKRYVANAHYKKLKGTYAVMDAVPKNIVTSKWKYYKCYTVLGAIRNYYKMGDYGKDVVYIQSFLKWAGFYSGKLDGSYDKKTADAVNRFQKAVGRKQTGQVGAPTIAAMKKYKK